MARTICLDFGNTRQKIALFQDDDLKEVIVLSDLEFEVSNLLEKFNPDYSILSSVIDHSPEIEGSLKGKTAFHKLSNESRLPFSIPVGKPASVGADRLAIAAATVLLFPGMNNLAIGLGSCITYNFINQQHELLGGAISPGMEMRFKSMNEFTEKLPLVEADWNVHLTGYDTYTNLQSGVVLGIAKEIDGFIDAYANKYGNFNVLLTGGDIAIFEPHLKNKIFADSHLIFKGLYAISQINNA
jgi:type III pantothenate kinase